MRNEGTSPHQSIQTLGLRIQLSATAVATSFILIFVPNVETISFVAFFMGYMFPISFAFSTILTMVFTWEILATMVFSFSGITFPFKIVAWLLIGLLGNFARKIKARYFYEFMIFGLLSALIYDILTTISIALFFLNNNDAFFSVLVSNLVIGIVFTISHAISNAFLFSFKPLLYKSIIPLLENRYDYLLKVKNDIFQYLDTNNSTSISWEYLRVSKKRIAGYILITILFIAVFSGMFLSYNNSKPKPGSGDRIGLTVELDYGGVQEPETIDYYFSSNQTVFEILQQIASVEYETQNLIGILVIAINNVWNNVNMSNHYWFYFINGEYQNVGANSNYAVNGDVVTWKYQ